VISTRESTAWRSIESHPLLASDVPWILSNPLFVGVEPVLDRPAELACESVDAVSLGDPNRG